MIKSRWDKFIGSGNNFSDTMWCDLAGILAVRSRISLICTFAGAGNVVPVILSHLFILSSLARMLVQEREPRMIKNDKDQK